MQTPSSLNSNLITKGHIITEGQSTVLDWTRAAAAQVVLMAHLAEWFYVPFREKAKMVYISSAGSLAVAIFFVLSGALITNSISHQIRAQKFRLLHYARSRIARIYPTLLAALGITVICYILIKHLGLHGYPAYDKNDFVGEITRDSAQIKPSTVAATGLFLNGMIGIPGWNVGTVSMNGPLWSLAHEFWFYVIAGLWGAYLSNRNLWAVILTGLFITFQVFVGNWKWLVGLGVWLTGTSVLRPQRSMPSYAPILIFTIIGAAYFSGILFSGNLCAFGIQGLLAAGFLSYVLSHVKTAKPRSSRATLMAGYSYTLYAIHWPLLQLAFGAAGKWLITVNWTTHCLFCLMLVVSINYLSFKIARFTENTELWKGLLAKPKINLSNRA